jgi:aryl-alcohol dehydrogenase-like predicted oxidoreductase
LAGLRDRGVRVGLSTSGPAQADTVRRAIDITVAGSPLFTSVQSTWNVLEQSAGAALAEAAEAGAQVIVKEPVANGRLAPGGAGADDRGAIAAAGLAESLGVSVDQLAIAAAAARPWAWCVLSGAVTVEQLHSNLGGIGLDLPADVLEQLPALAEPTTVYWSTRSARAWT